MVKKNTQGHGSRKKSKFKRWSRSLFMKTRRWIASCQKWIKRHQPFRKRKTKDHSVTLEPVFQAPDPLKNFFTITRIVTFVTLFAGAGGAYLWFHLTSHYFIENETSHPFYDDENTDGEGNKQQQSAAIVPSVPVPNSLAASSTVMTAAEERNTVFSMQPYIKLDAQVPLVKTINPQFFIQAADNKTQKIAVLVVGLGINETLTDQILSQMPKNVSLVFSPYSPDLEDLIDFARYEDFSILVASPLEDEDPVTDQGYLTLKTRVSEEENLENLKKITLHARQADCIYGQGGARLLRSSKEMKPIFQYMREVNNCFVAPPDILVNKLHEVAAALQLNYACTTIENPTTSMMPSIEALTKRTGFSILAFDAKPGIVDEIKEWIKNLEQAKISVVPITEIIHH